MRVSEKGRCRCKGAVYSEVCEVCEGEGKGSADTMRSGGEDEAALSLSACTQASTPHGTGTATGAVKRSAVH